MLVCEREGEFLTIDATRYKGRIFFTSDLHGCYDLLHEKLYEVSFDSSRDILISGGDWADRGVDSKYVLDYLSEPWIHSVRANHEQLVIQTYEDGFIGPAAGCLMANGGEWYFDLNDQDPIHAKAIYDTFKSLPLGIELITPTETIGIVHAQCPYNDWNRFKKISADELEWDGMATAQWARSNYDRRDEIIVKGVDRLLVGHTPVNSGEVEVLGNVWYTDLGSFFRNKISFIQLM